MSLQPQGASRSIDEQNRREYATQHIFREIYKSVMANDGRGQFGVNKMKEVRRRWNKDFSTQGYSLSDFSNLANILPSTPPFNESRERLNDEEYIKQELSVARDGYTALAERDLHPVLILDPQLQDVPGLTSVNSFLRYTRGMSLRHLNPGQDLTIVDRDNNVAYQGQNLPGSTVSNPFNTADQSRPQAGQRTQRQQTQNQGPMTPESDEFREVAYTGWSSSESQPMGLNGYLGAYFSRTDQEKLRKHFDEKKIEISEGHAHYLENSVEVLKYLRSNGIDFEVRDFYQDGQIDVKLDGSNIQVRIFDLDETYPGQNIGRVYDTYSVTRLQKKNEREFEEFEPEESVLPLKAVLGDIPAVYRKTASNANAQIHDVEGLGSGKYILIDRQSEAFRNRFDGIMFASDEIATAYLEDTIEGARDYFEQQFKADELQQLIEDPESIDRDSVLSFDLKIRERQEALIDDIQVIQDMIDSPFEEDLKTLVTSVEITDELIEQLKQEDVQMFDILHHEIEMDMVGTFEDGFNPTFVIEHAPENENRQHSRNSVMSALRHLDYDKDKIKGNEFATQNIIDNMVTFDEDSAVSIDDIEDPFLRDAMQAVQDELVTVGVIGADHESAPNVQIDEQGIIRWEGHRSALIARRGGKAPRGTVDLPNGDRIEEALISGEIGQIFSPNEHGIIQTDYASGANHGLVPGYTGYFKFDGEYTDDRMDRLRVKGFEQHLDEQLKTLVRNQVSRPIKPSWGNIPNVFDSTNLNSLYHGDVYGRRIELDFIESSKLDPEITDAIITSLSNRVRFGNEYGDYATTNAEAQAKIDTQHDNQSEFAYWRVAGETNMRVLADDLENIADLTMTGNARTQGLTWYLVDGASVNRDGTINKSDGILDIETGEFVPDKSAIRKLKHFEFEDYNAWDRVQMSANQLMTAEHVDEGVGTAMMSFGGWTYEDAFLVSKEFAERNQVQGNVPIEESMDKLNELIDYLNTDESTDRNKVDLLEGTGMNWSDELIQEGIDLKNRMNSLNGDELEVAQRNYNDYLEQNGTFRPLKPGDKLSDFGGNKGTIGEVVDRDMPLDQAREIDFDREVAIFSANPGLDVVAAPYSPLSRFNAGIIKELQSDGVEDIVDPLWNDGEGRVLEGGLGKLNFIVTDLTVDEKTHAYTQQDVADGKGRLASGQLAWALQSHDAVNMLSEIYGHNDNAWATFREYMIATGLDFNSNGALRIGYEPHDYTETRKTFDAHDYETSADFLNQITDEGGFLKIPFDVKFATGESTNEIPILSSALRQDTELIDGTMRSSDYNNNYTKIFNAVREYIDLDDLGQIDDPAKERDRQNSMSDAKRHANDSFGELQTEIIDRQFEGGANGKYSFIRTNLMGKRMKHSATGVAISDPRMSVNDIAMDEDVMSSLDVNEGDHIMSFRDPVWRQSAVSGQQVVLNDRIRGFGVNPITIAPKDGDFDGDTLGAFKLSSAGAIEEIKYNLAVHNNLIDIGSSDERLYVPTDQDFASALAESKELGDNRMEELYESIDVNARSSDERLRKKAVRDLDEYVRLGFRVHGFGADHINLKSRETVKASLEQIVERGGKGSPDKLDEVMDYYDGKKGRDDAKSIQYAKGVQTDDTGLGGAVTQRLVTGLRNLDIDPALEITYPVSQSILQVKHDDKHAVKIDNILRREIRNLYAGKSSDGKRDNMTKKAWVNDYHNILTSDDYLGVDVRKDYVERVADMMAGENGNTIRPINEVIDDLGSPMDRSGYGGGWNSLFEISKENKKMTNVSKHQSLLDGKYSKLFAPESMRSGEANIIARKDVRDLEQEVEVQTAFEEGFAQSTQEVVDEQVVPDDGPVM